MLPRRASAAILAVCLLAASCTPVAPDEPTLGTVVKVYDGDTVTIEPKDARHRCRFQVTDIPEPSYARLWTEMGRASRDSSLEGRREFSKRRSKHGCRYGSGKRWRTSWR